MLSRLAGTFNPEVVWWADLPRERRRVPVPHDPRKVAKTVGARVAELRRRRGWTQADLGERLGCTPQWVSKIEIGGRMSLDTLVELANAFRIDVTALFDAPTEALPAKPKGRPRTKR